MPFLTIVIAVVLTTLTMNTSYAEKTVKTKIANPASEHCLSQGGDLVIKTKKDGGEYGVCRLKDGTECEEWAFFRGQCPQRITFKDPFEYCKAIQTIDTPDDRFVGNKRAIVNAMVRQGLISAKAPKANKNNFLWRCMDGQVYVCQLGANVPCNQKANRSMEPTQAMKDYCKEHPQNDFIPSDITGRSTIYQWRCQEGSAVIVKEITSVDKQGYISGYWTPLKPR